MRITNRLSTASKETKPRSTCQIIVLLVVLDWNSSVGLKSFFFFSRKSEIFQGQIKIMNHRLIYLFCISILVGATSASWVPLLRWLEIRQSCFWTSRRPVWILLPDDNFGIRYHESAIMVKQSSSRHTGELALRLSGRFLLPCFWHGFNRVVRSISLTFPARYVWLIDAWPELPELGLT